MLDSLNAGDHEMFILGWSNTSFDADGSTYQLFYSENHGATGNRAFLTDEKVDELIIAAQEEAMIPSVWDSTRSFRIVSTRSPRGARYTTNTITSVSAQT